MNASVTPRRADLLELTPEALMALANPGFVKRALKDIAEGPLPQLEEDADGTVRARFGDGQCATLPPGRTVREASCSCPASGLCRHRVTLVLAYQRWAASGEGDDSVPVAAAETTQWSPAQFDAAALAQLPAARLEAALRLAGAQPSVRVTAWSAQAPVPSAQLPMCTVRFFSRSNLMHARCDCKQGGGCEHVVLAVWAFAQARGLAPGQSQVVALAGPARTQGARQRWFDPEAAAPVAELDALLLQLWLDGSSQSPIALEARLEAVRERCAGWCWVLEALAELRALLAAQHARSSGFDPQCLLRAVVQLPARLLAARAAERLAGAGGAPMLPAAQILGVGIKGEVALDHLRLVSLGAQCWHDEQAEGVRIVFADPDTQAVTVLERSWPIAAGAASAGTMARRVSGRPVRQLASSQVVTRGARRRANGLIEIATGTRESSILPLSGRAWDTLAAPLRQTGARALRAHLLDAPPDFVRPLQAIDHLHVLPVTRVLEWGWDAVTQTLQARILSADAEPADAEDTVHLALPHRQSAPGAVDALARALQGEWGTPTLVAGIARLAGGRLQLQPLSLLTEQRAVVLEAEAGARQSLPLRVIDRPLSTLEAVVQATCELLASWLRQGLRHQGAGALARGQAQADALREVGLAQASAALGAVLAALQGQDRHALPTRLAGLILLLDGVIAGTPADADIAPDRSAAAA